MHHVVWRSMAFPPWSGLGKARLCGNVPAGSAALDPATDFPFRERVSQNPLSLEGEGWGEGEKQWFIPSPKPSALASCVTLPPASMQSSPLRGEGFCDNLRERGIRCI